MMNWIFSFKNNKEIAVLIIQYYDERIHGQHGDYMFSCTFDSRVKYGIVNLESGKGLSGSMRKGTL